MFVCCVLVRASFVLLDCLVCLLVCLFDQLLCIGLFVCECCVVVCWFVLSCVFGIRIVRKIMCLPVFVCSLV